MILSLQGKTALRPAFPAAALHAENAAIALRWWRQCGNPEARNGRARRQRQMPRLFSRGLRVSVAEPVEGD